MGRRHDGWAWVADHPLLADLRHVLGWLCRRRPDRPSWLAVVALLVVVGGVVSLLLAILGR